MAADLPTTGLLVLANTGLGHQAPHHGQVAVNGSCRTHLLALARRAVHCTEHRTYLDSENPQDNPTPKAQGWAGYQKLLLLELTARLLGHTGDKVP